MPDRSSILEPSLRARRDTSGLRRPVALGDVQVLELGRLSTGLEHFDRVLSTKGGAVRGGTALLGGDPGVGKSTLLLQTMSHLARTAGGPVLYVSGEESDEQIAERAERIGGVDDGLLILAEKDLDTVLGVIEEARPVALVVDSAQTLRSSTVNGRAGGITQVRHVGASIVEQSKRLRVALFLVCHVTKGAELAGPEELKHLVDTVLYFERVDKKRRRLFAEKNRFGSEEETALFEHGERGLRAAP